MGSALGSQSIEEFDQITTQREARGLTSQRDEGVDQTRLVQSRERSRPPEIDLDLYVAEQIQRPREAAHAATGSLGDYGESPDLGHQEVQDPIGLAEVDGATGESRAVAVTCAG